ncbi:MAG: mechanosensitive ion channel [Acidobacteria bacterium]|nr:mechanosensitive ion channel [Acidobacteriota bacterium]MDA1236714.1 mechanosensitive ion channel [Acidobacteriota bacterium]
MTERLQQILFDPAVGQLAAAVVGVALVFGLVKLLQRSLSNRFQEPDTRYRIRKFITFIGYIIAIFVVANVYNDRLTGLTVAFGVAGAGIAFALQEVIASVAGWIALTFGGFYKTGQRVRVAGIKGDVIDIGVLRTTLMEVGEWVNGDLYNGRIVRVANSFVLKEPVFNYSADFPFLWDELRLPLAYASDREQARALILSCVEEVIGDYPAQSRAAWKQMVGKYLIEDASVEPMVTMSGADSSLIFTARYIVDYRKRRFTQDRIFTRILEEIDATKGAVRLPAASLEITGVPPISIRQPS